MSSAKVFHICLFIGVFCLLTAGLSAANSHKNTDFTKEPVKYMSEIYSDYHNWKVDEGISKAKNALNIVNKMYASSPNSVIKDPKLKLNKAYQVKSTLHTLLGMLSYRKSLMLISNGRQEKLKPILEKIEKGKGLTEKDLEEYDRQARNDKSYEESQKYMMLAKDEFQAAIKADPSNPAPHFHLGSIYSAASVGGKTEDAEQELFTAARLSYLEGDKKSVDRALEALKAVNPKSAYLKKFDALKRGKNE